MSLDFETRLALASMSFILAKPRRVIITRGFYDLSSVNHATVTPPNNSALIPTALEQ
jgi:hypothetical protein